MADNREKGLNRSFKIDRSKIDAEKRTVEMAFSSEEPVERWGENEVLGHGPGEYDFSRLNSDHPLLLGHRENDPLSQIGVIESARVDGDKVGRAVVRFSSSDLGKQIFQDVQDGIRKLVSVGYDRTGIIKSEKAKDGMVTTRYRWQPAHIAIVPVPADMTVGVGREREVDFLQTLNADDIANNLTSEQRSKMKILLDPNPAAGGGGAATTTAPTTTVDAQQIRAAALTSYRERNKQIRAVAEELIKDRPDLTEKLRGMAGEAENTDEEVGAFQVRAMKEVIRTKPAKQVTMAALGYDERDIQSYSLVRAIQNCILRQKQQPDEDTIEGDAHKRMAKLDLGYTTNGFFVPPDAPINQRSLSRADRRRMGRDMQVNIFGQGGATVATELVTPIIEILRNKMVTQDLGVRVLAGLEGNVVIPRQTGAGTAYAVSEIASLTLSNQVLDQIPISPKRVGATGQYSKQLLLQSSIDVESFMRDDFLKVIAIMWDRLILNGQGANSEPLGIMNTPGVGSVTFAAAATFAKLVSFWTAVATANADVGDMAYVTTPKAAGTLQSAAKLLVGATTVAAVPLWEGGGTEGMINGYRARATNQMPNDQMLFGVFSEVIHALWGGYDVVVDPYTLAKNAEVVITMNTWGDVALRHAQCFCVSSDSAAQ